MEGPRAPESREFPRVVSFLNHNLRPEGSWSIAAEYPLALTPTNLHNMRIITEADEVLSHAVVKPIVTKTPVGYFKVAAIGSVVTSLQHRNRGLSQRVLEDCLQVARDQACEFAILWTDLFDFYRKIGFELAGTEISVQLQPSFLHSDSQLRILETSQIAPDALLRVYNQHTVCSVRTADDIARFLQIPNARVYTAWDANHRLQAYAIEGKGADLKGYVHEWGGGVSKLLPLFSYIRQKHPLTVIVPAHAKGLLRALQDQPATLHSGFLGMVKLLEPESVFQKVKRHARSLGHADLVLEEEGRFLLGVGDDIVQMGEHDLVRLLFGPATPAQLTQLKAETREILSRVLPVPLWVWGWDSI